MLSLYLPQLLEEEAIIVYANETAHGGIAIMKGNVQMQVFSATTHWRNFARLVLVYLILGLILPVSLNLALPHAAHAANPTVITVNSPDDEDNPSDGDGHNCTLRKALNDADAGTSDTFVYPNDCNLTAVTPGPPYNIVFSGVTSVTLTNNPGANTGSISVNQTTSIKGPISISGNDVTDIFVVHADLKMVLVNLQHGKAANNGSGGAIRMDGGTLTVAQGIFDSNNASADGGAIDFSGTAMSLNNTIFTNNSADGGNGGAIHITGGGATFAFITNALFGNNTANDNDGAIYTSIDNTGTFGNYAFTGMLLTNSAFSLNTAKAAKSDPTGATEGGGAIYNDSNGFVGVVSGIFGLPGPGGIASTGNTVKGTAGRGGAIYNASGGQLYVNQGYFNNNQVSSDTNGYGGAIYNRNNMLLVGDYFGGNTTTGSGGALANDATTDATANVVNATFNGNSAVVEGGAVYTFFSSGGTASGLNLYNDTLDSNTAPNGKGGGIFNDTNMQGSGGITLGNTIVANNSGGNCALGTFNGTAANAITDAGHNIEFPNATATVNTCFGNSTNSDQFGDPKLQSPHPNFPDNPIFPVPPTPPLTLLAWTESIPVGSSALFNGDNSICGMIFPPAVTTHVSGVDARNSKRPNPSNTNCDIGAFESSIDLTSHPTMSEVFAPATISTGGSSSLNFNLTNPYNQSFSSVSFVATVDAGVTLGATTNGCDPNATLAINGQQISLSNLNLAANQQCTISVAVTGPTNGTFHSLIPSISTNESGSTNLNLDTTLTVQTTPIINPPSLTQVFNPSPIVVGSGSKLSFVTTNPNSAQQLDDVAFTANLDPAITVNIAGAVITCGNNNTSLTLTYKNNQIQVGKMTLASNQQCTIQIPVVGTKVGALPSAIGSVSSSEANLNNLDSITSLVVQPLPPFTITATAGTPQTTTVGMTFTNLQATVLDKNSMAVSGAKVTFVAPASGASGTFPSGNTAITDVNGNASVAFTANGTTGNYNVTANVNPALTPPATFVLTNTAGNPASITVSGGDAQSTQINTAFASPLQAIVKDSFGNAVSNVTVTYTAPNSGASTNPAVKTAMTNAQGKASLTVTANSTAGGPYVVNATVVGVNTSAVFNLTNTVGPVTNITVAGGDGQSTQISTAFASPLQALVTDAGSNPIPNVTVTYTGPNTGASTNPAINTAITGANGIASLPVTANAIVGGPYVVNATVVGVNTPAIFNLTNTNMPPPSPAFITATGGTPQTTTVNTTFATKLQATVTDSSSKPIQGLTVTFTAPASGASGTFVGVNTAITDVNGNASVTFKANTVVGAYNVTANINPALNPAATFALTNTAGSANSITITGGNNQSTQINTAFANPLQAVVKDSFGNAVAGVSVTFASPSSGASATFVGNATITSDTNGAVSIGVAANGTTGSYHVTATAQGVATPATFGLTNVNNAPPPLPTLTIAVVSGSPQSTVVKTAFATNLQAKVTDTTNTAVSGVQVTFTVPSSGASANFAGNNLTYTVTTDANGLATATTLTANSNVGSYDVVAAGVGVSNTAAFHLTNASATGGSGPSSYNYYLPFLANNWNGFTTYVSFQNYGNATANLTFQFYDATGAHVVNPSGICNTLAQYAECTVPNPLASQTKGTGVITSDQPLSVLVAETTPYGGSSYAVPTGTGSQLTASLAINNFYGGFVTRLTVGNFGQTTSNVTVNFYDYNGALQSAATRTVSIAAHTSATLDQSSTDSNLPSGFNGWAQVTGDAGSQLVAQVLEQNPNNHFVALVNAQTTSQTTLFAPAIFHNAFGGYVTGSNIVNPNNNSVNVTVTYYRNDGTIIPTTPFTLAPHAIAGIYQGRTDNIGGLPDGGLLLGFYGAAKVSATGGGVVMMVNEASGTLANGGARSGTYSAASGGSSQLGLPVVANNGSGFTSGVTILNTSGATINGTIQYYNLDGTPQGSPQTFNVGGNAGSPASGLAAHVSLPIYQGNLPNALPTGFYGTAVITQTSGPANSLATTVNMESANVFYTYALPTQ